MFDLYSFLIAFACLVAFGGIVWALGRERS